MTSKIRFIQGTPNIYYKVHPSSVLYAIKDSESPIVSHMVYWKHLEGSSKKLLVLSIC